VLILKRLKIVCFRTLLQVLILGHLRHSGEWRAQEKTPAGTLAFARRDITHPQYTKPRIVERKIKRAFYETYLDLDLSSVLEFDWGEARWA
jgi:hypothetical protein